MARIKSSKACDQSDLESSDTNGRGSGGKYRKRKILPKYLYSPSPIKKPRSTALFHFNDGSGEKEWGIKEVEDPPPPTMPTTLGSSSTVRKCLNFDTNQNRPTEETPVLNKINPNSSKLRPNSEEPMKSPRNKRVLSVPFSEFCGKKNFFSVCFVGVNWSNGTYLLCECHPILILSFNATKKNFGFSAYCAIIKSALNAYDIFGRVGACQVP